MFKAIWSFLSILIFIYLIYIIIIKIIEWNDERILRLYKKMRKIEEEDIRKKETEKILISRGFTGEKLSNAMKDNGY